MSAEAYLDNDKGWHDSLSGENSEEDVQKRLNTHNYLYETSIQNGLSSQEVFSKGFSIQRKERLTLVAL